MIGWTGTDALPLVRWKRRRKVPLQFQSPTSAAGFLIDLTLSPVLAGQKLRNQQPKECPYAQQPALTNWRFGFVLVVGFGAPRLCGVSIREYNYRLFVLLRPLRAALDRHRRPSRQEVRSGSQSRVRRPRAATAVVDKR